MKEEVTYIVVSFIFFDYKLLGAEIRCMSTKRVALDGRETSCYMHLAITRKYPLYEWMTN